MLSLTIVWLTGTWHLLGFRPGTAPFTDLGFVLAALECTRLGIDVAVVNPCDIASRSFIYPPAWLALSPLPLDQADTVWLGSLLIAAYATVAAGILQPKNGTTWMIGIALLLSPSSMYLMERGNVDALLFVLAVLVLLLATGSRARRDAACAVVAVATLLKVYPLALLPMTLPRLGPSPWRSLSVLALLLVAASGYAVWQWDAIVGFVSGVPAQPSLTMFGAAIFPWSIELVAGISLPAGSASPALLALLFLILTAGLSLAFRRRMDLSALPQDPRNAYLFAGGTGILIFCFLTAINVPYRSVFVILTVPYLIDLARTKQSRARWLAWWLLAWSVVSCWQMLIMVTAINHFAGLVEPQAAATFKVLLDTYIITFQLATWLALASLGAMGLQILYAVHCPRAG